MASFKDSEWIKPAGIGTVVAIFIGAYWVYRDQSDSNVSDSGVEPEQVVEDYLSIVTVGLGLDYDVAGEDHHVTVQVAGRRPVDIDAGTWIEQRKEYKCGEMDRPCVVNFDAIVESIYVESRFTYRLDDKKVSVVVGRNKPQPITFSVTPDCRSPYESQIRCGVTLPDAIYDSLYYVE